MKHALGHAVAAIAACCALNAGATAVTMAGTCSADCANLGLPTGGAVWATFDLAGPIGANQLLLKDAVLSFSVHFGNIAFDNDDLSNWDFAVLTDGNGQVGGLQFLASFGSSLTVLGDSIDLREDRWWSSHAGACAGAFESGPCAWGSALAASELEWGSATFTVAQDALAVPEPGSLALAGAALLGLFGVRRGATTGRHLVAGTPSAA